MLGIIRSRLDHKPGEKCRNFSYPDISLIRYGSDRPVDKGVRIIEIALYMVHFCHGGHAQNVLVADLILWAWYD